MGAGG